MTGLRELLREAQGTLRQAGVDPRDATRLARALLARHAGDGALLELVDIPSAALERDLRAAVARRAAREPLQLIVGYVDFRGATIATAPGVFIPRFETELVCGEAVAAARALAGRDEPVRVVDLCTGSGAIATAIAREVPGCLVWAVEQSTPALALAARNAAANGVAVTVVAGDAADALGELDGTVDVVVSNPPYIPPDGVPRDPEVLEWDPPTALYGGGADGLDVPRSVMRSARRLLRPGGVLVMEHADVQGPAVRHDLALLGGFTVIVTLPDLTGRDRMVRATRLAGAPQVRDWHT